MTHRCFVPKDAVLALNTSLHAYAFDNHRCDHGRIEVVVKVLKTTSLDPAASQWRLLHDSHKERVGGRSSSRDVCGNISTSPPMIQSGIVSGFAGS